MYVCIYTKLLSLSFFSSRPCCILSHRLFFFKRLFSNVGTVPFQTPRWVWDTVRFQTPPLGVGHRSFSNANAGCGTPFGSKRPRWVWDTVRLQTPPLGVTHRSFSNATAATAGCGTPFVSKRHCLLWNTAPTALPCVASC